MDTSLRRARRRCAPPTLRTSLRKDRVKPMGRKRQYGDGTVFYEESRKRWVAMVDLGFDAGGKRRRRKLVGATKQTVIDRLNELHAGADAGLDLAGIQVTVAELLERWQRDVLPGKGSKQTTDTYRWAINSYLAPHLGRHRLAQLRAEHVEAMLRSMAAAGMARSSCVKVRFVLGAVLRWAQRRDLVMRNVAELADLPHDARRAREGRALTPEEARKLLNAARGDRLEALWLVALGLGMRPGEIAGLTWADIDLEPSVLHVRRAMKYDADRPIGLGELKTGTMGRGRRSLVMPAAVTDALRRHRIAQAGERLAMGEQWPAEWRELVFVSQAGTPLNAANLRRDLNRFSKAAGVGHVTRYDLRHSAATMLGAMGVRIEDVADILGHEDLRMARIVYMHASGRPLTAGTAAMESVLGAQGG
jgi:integrase